MLRQFVKYHGAGNDFIIFSGRPDGLDIFMRSYLCDRRTGIGADGLIFVENSNDGIVDFIVHFYNSDGKLGPLCGNGSRCAISHAQKENFFFNGNCDFIASDGTHQGEILRNGLISVNFRSSFKAVNIDSGYFINTGSPHYVEIVKSIDDDAIMDLAPAKRRSVNEPIGCNVNYVEIEESQKIRMRTFEKGVESETYSCGTGAVAVALVLNQFNDLQPPLSLVSNGGVLIVDFLASADGYEKIILTGPVVKVYSGEWNI